MTMPVRGSALLFLMVLLRSAVLVVADVCITKACTVRATRMIEVMNDTVDPCEDFWQYSCGQWTRIHKHPTNNLDLLDDIVHKALMGLLSEPIHVKDSTAVRMTKKYYQSCANVTQLELLRDQPLLDIVNDAFDNLPDGLTSRLIAITNLRIAPLLDVSVGRYYLNTSLFVLKISEPSLNLRREVYLGANFTESRKTYLDYFTDSMHRVKPELDRDTWREYGQSVIDLEVQLARITLSPAEAVDRHKVYSHHTLSGLQSRYPAIDWCRLFHGIFEKLEIYHVHLPDDMVVMSYADQYLDRLFPVLSQTQPDTIHTYFMWSAVLSMIPYTLGNLSYYKAIFNNESRKTDQQEDRCVWTLKTTLPEVVGLMYTEAFVSQQQKKNARDMIRNVMSAFRHVIQGAHWMSESAKRRATEKLAAMKVQVGASPGYERMSVMDRKYDGVNVSSFTFLDNEMAITWRQNRLMFLDFLRQPEDFKENMQSAVVNAFYLTLSNAIIIPSGILLPGIFSPLLPDSLNYGSLGSVVGHEITHGFDAEGRLTDAHGNMQDWWEVEDARRFEKRAQCLRDQFDQFWSQRANASVNGNLTLNENIADLGSLHTAYVAFKRLQRHVAGHPTKMTEQRLPGISNLDPHQLFFLSFAQTWCSHVTAQRLFCNMKTGNHSPEKYRVLGSIINNPDFGRVFNCPVGSPMNPRKKCRIW